jgi:RNA polymerase sigma factor (sigma-70 family)
VVDITGLFEKERARLRNFIRKRVADEWEAEDILQDVFYELIEAYRMMEPIEHATAWLFRVARNRITDLFRKTKPQQLDKQDLLPSSDDAPDAEYARTIFLEQLQAALDELPANQREVFVAHEIEGRSFKELAAITGVSVNTLISRKHYAVLHLRERLQSIYGEFRGKL